MTKPTIPVAFHVMAKPAGARCNLDCEYCFFLKKLQLYPNSSFRMSNKLMESYIRQTIESHRVPEVTIAWQGGEPTLMGLNFYRRAVAVEKKYAKPGVKIVNTLQTNGILLDDKWCEFLHKNGFLVGLSIDGPKHLHDKYRKDKAGKSVFSKVVNAVRLLQKHKVEFNILCTVNSANSLYPLKVYRFFRDELKAEYIQFIPVVERDNESCSVQSEQYGQFLIEIFDEWIERDVGSMFVQMFDGVLAAWLRGYSTLCILRSYCGESVALEHNGDVYSCDHYVEPDYLLGNIAETSLLDLVGSKQQYAFGKMKSDTLPTYCRNCEFLFTCHGGCPKNRIISTPDGEPGLNWLCSGLKAFFAHTKKPMLMMADLLRDSKTAADIMQMLESF
jgi:uncharacterized protein